MYVSESFRKFQHEMNSKFNLCGLQMLIDDLTSNKVDVALKKLEILKSSFATNRRCCKCGNVLLYSDSPKYNYTCVRCCENTDNYKTKMLGK